MPDINLELYKNLPEEMPRTKPGVTTKFFRWLFSAMGWRVIGDIPKYSRAILVLAPHTSNWDFFIALVAKFSLCLKASYVMKQEAFFWPFRNWLIHVGGIPIDRSQPTRIVDQVTKVFNSSGDSWLAITPEGTRKKVTKYKTGFVRIAHAAKVPIIVAGFDYQQKAIVFSKVLEPSGDHEADADQLYHYCRETFHGKHPQNQ